MQYLAGLEASSVDRIVISSPIFDKALLQIETIDVILPSDASVQRRFRFRQRRSAFPKRGETFRDRFGNGRRVVFFGFSD